MRFLLTLACAACLASVVSAQDRALRDARRPIFDSGERPRLPIPRPQELEPQDEQRPHKVVLRLSESVFSPLVHRQIDHQILVQDVILGTPVSGVAHTLGQPHIDLVPHENQAAFNVVMEGTTDSRTTGRNGPAVIQSRSTTRFRAVKPVLFSPREGFYSLPAQVATNTQLVTENVGSTRGGLVGRIVRRRAWQEVQGKHAQAQAIADERARRRVAAVLDEELSQRIATLNRRQEIRSLVATVLTGSSEPRFACCTTEHYVQVAVSLRPDRKRSIDLPTADYLTSPVQLWVHRSVLRPEFPAIVSRITPGRLNLSGCLSLAHVAPAVAVGSELLKTAAQTVQESAPLDVETIDDWTVVTFSDEPRSGRIVRR